MQHFIGVYGYFAIFILMVAEPAHLPSAPLGAAQRSNPTPESTITATRIALLRAPGRRTDAGI